MRVLLLGGHGKVAKHITKHLLERSHEVVSIIRNPDHAEDILSLADTSQQSHLHPTVLSLEDAEDDKIRSAMHNIDWVIWSAGAGGKGGPERTKAVDLHAANRFFSFALAAPSVTQFLTVSASVARREPASWWSENDRETYKKGWESIPGYCEAKTAHDEFLSAESRKTNQKNWRSIVLRPGTLSDDKGSGKVDLGKSRLEGKISREDVAKVAVCLLEKQGKNGVWWLDLMQGEESIEEAVDRVIQQEVTVE